MIDKAKYPHDHTLRLRLVDQQLRQQASYLAFRKVEALLGPSGDTWVGEWTTQRVTIHCASLDDLKAVDRALLADGISQGGGDHYPILEAYEHHHTLDLGRWPEPIADKVIHEMVDLATHLLGEPSDEVWGYRIDGVTCAFGVMQEYHADKLGAVLKAHLETSRSELQRRQQS